MIVVVYVKNVLGKLVSELKICKAITQNVVARVGIMQTAVRILFDAFKYRERGK